MTYEELSIYGRLRKNDKLGPYGMYTKLLAEWGTRLSPLQVRAVPTAARLEADLDTPRSPRRSSCSSSSMPATDTR